MGQTQSEDIQPFLVCLSCVSCLCQVVIIGTNSGAGNWYRKVCQVFSVSLSLHSVVPIPTVLLSQCKYGQSDCHNQTCVLPHL